jgi:hypothetical protein
MHRGNTPVARKDVDQKNVHELADLMGNWLIRQVHEDGRMTYKYWPSPGKEASSNNMIRQFMATVCLERLARFRKEEGLFQLAERNLEYNLSHFYHPEGDLGLIEYNKKAKLGDAAMAALAIAECRNPETLSGTSDRLLKLIDTLHQTNGSFRTFYRPKERNDNQNFYSGEALLLWATLYDRTQGPELLAKIMLSFNYYRRWHLDNRNPAFVPWHTQAYFIVWQHTRDVRLRDFIFEMNDWLVNIQQWEYSAYEDTKGQFYSPAHPEYGPPHASSTGVYLEGLTDAYQLAREVGDAARTKRYRRTIIRGLRSVMQLQFKDDIDMFYILERDRVYGGIRTTVYDNTIRVDNVQHNLMAVLKILRVFKSEDYLDLYSGDSI